MIRTLGVPPSIVSSATLGWMSNRRGPAAPGFTAMRSFVRARMARLLDAHLEQRAVVVDE